MSLLKSGVTLFASHGAAALLSFVRNVIVARALGVEEFGVASTFAVIFALVEIATDTGLEKLIVRDPDGDEQSFLSTMHTIFVVRGVIAAGIMLLLAYPFAAYMGVEDIVWAYQVLALAPLIRGFVHFDIFRKQRHMQFRGLIVATVAAPFCALMVVAATSYFVQDYRVVLWSLIAYQTAYMVASHLTAERAFRLGWNWEITQRSIRFGLPLLLNGMLMFALLQGDRLIIGGEIGTDVLGWFSVAWLLTSTPAFVLINTIRSVFLPRLSERVAEHGLREEATTATIEAGAYAGIALVAIFFVVGPSALLIVYGSDYAEALTVLQPIAVAFAFRLIVASETTIALAGDDTPTPLIAGIIRTLFVPLAYLAAVAGFGAIALAWIAVAGELASAIAGAWRLRAKLRVSLWAWMPAIGLLSATVIAALALDTILLQPSPSTTPSLWMCVPFLVLTLLAPLPMRALRATIFSPAR